jgi:acyl-CoA synthetase (AMP-forming)/AMP-acid ligase II
VAKLEVASQRTRQKTRERVIVVDALPVSATGKVLKQQLRQQLKDEQAKF